MKPNEISKKSEKIKVKVKAINKNWEEVYNKSRVFLSSLGAKKKDILDMLLSIEEIFVNIYSYAYPNSEGYVSIDIDYISETDRVTILFEDEGIPFDPTKKDDPDITLSAEERQIGGLGIYMVKKLTDSMTYEYKNNKNRLKLDKKLRLGGEQNEHNGL